MELLPDVLGGSGTQSVEDVVVSLLGALSADPRLLQQVVRHEAANDDILTARKQKNKRNNKRMGVKNILNTNINTFFYAHKRFLSDFEHNCIKNPCSQTHSCLDAD